MADQKELMMKNHNFPYINPLTSGEHECEPLHSCGPTTRLYWLLHYVLSGRGKFATRGNSITVTAHQCFIIRPNEMIYYEADKDDPWHYVWIGFTSEIPLPEILTQNLVFNAERFGHVFWQFTDAREIYEGREAFVYGKLWELLALLSNEVAQPLSKAESYIAQAKNYIESSYMEKITVKQIADQLHLDRSYFSTLFKKYTGISPQQYLNTYGLEQAKELLISHGYTPTEAARSTGYGDVISFSHMFKNHFGQAPTKYRDNERQKQIE